jgi:hypothetical protein
MRAPTQPPSASNVSRSGLRTALAGKTEPSTRGGLKRRWPKPGWSWSVSDPRAAELVEPSACTACAMSGPTRGVQLTLAASGAQCGRAGGHRDSESTRSRDGGCADRHGAELCAIATSLLPVREGGAILAWTWRKPLAGVQAHNLAGLATEATELRLLAC